MTDEEQEMMDAIGKTASNDSDNNDDFDSFGPNPEEDESAAENGPLDGTSGDDSDTSSSSPSDPWSEQDTVAVKHRVEEQLAIFDQSISSLPKDDLPKLHSLKKLVLQDEIALQTEQQKLPGLQAEKAKAKTALDEVTSSGNSAAINARREKLKKVSADVSDLESGIDLINTRLQKAKNDFDIAYLTVQANDWSSKIEKLSLMTSMKEFEQLKLAREEFSSEIARLSEEIQNTLDTNAALMNEFPEDSETYEEISKSNDRCSEWQNDIKTITDTLEMADAQFKDIYAKVQENGQEASQALQTLSIPKSEAIQSSIDTSAFAILFRSMTDQVADLKRIYDKLEQSQNTSQKQIEELLDKTSSLKQAIEGMKATVQQKDIDEISRKVSNSTDAQIMNRTNAIAEAISAGLKAQIEEVSVPIKESCEGLKKLNEEVAGSIAAFEKSAQPLKDFSDTGKKNIETISKQITDRLNEFAKTFNDDIKKKVDDACKDTYSTTELIVKKWYVSYGLGRIDSFWRSPLVVLSTANFFLLCVLLFKISR